MLRRTIVKSVAAAALPLTAILGATAASAAPSPNVSFSASDDGASAGWSQGKGSPIDLTLGSDSASTYAVITLHHLAPTTIAQTGEPEFSTDNYAAGSPRFYVTLSDGHSLWGYPSNAGLGSSGAHLSWAIDNGNSYLSWTTVQQSGESAAAVTGAFVIADGDQSPGTTDAISGLTFNNLTFN
jgi:hypothetical protein